jgi:AraC-like DNA-binding protein
MALDSRAALSADSPHLHVRYVSDAQPVERGATGAEIDILFARGGPLLQAVFSGRRRRRLPPARGVCVVPPETAYAIEAGSPWELLSLSLDFSAVGRFRCDDRIVAADPVLQQFASILCTGLRSGCPPPARFLESLVEPIGRHLVECYGVRPSESDGALAPHKLHRARAYVAANLGQPFGLDDVADAVGLSTFHFARTFRRATGETPHAYITRMRMEEAKRLMEESPLSLEEISQRVGYRTHSHFSSAFRKAAGVTPSAYRRTGASG